MTRQTGRAEGREAEGRGAVGQGELDGQQPDVGLARRGCGPSSSVNSGLCCGPPSEQGGRDHSRMIPHQ